MSTSQGHRGRAHLSPDWRWSYLVLLSFVGMGVGLMGALALHPALWLLVAGAVVLGAVGVTSSRTGRTADATARPVAAGRAALTRVRAMTFSIAARSADGQTYGVAVASKFLAVGAAVPAARAGVGAIATQAWANLAYRPQGLALLETGTPAAGVVAGLTAADAKAASRQLGVVGTERRRGVVHRQRTARAWAGGRTGDGYAIQGNILTGPEVVDAMEAAWLASDPAAPLARRLLAALRAGDDAGGDRRGRQSAALYVVTPGGGYGGGSDVLVDVRSDDHPDPVAELHRLVDLYDLYFGSPDPDALLDLAGELAEEVRARLRRAGAPGEDGRRPSTPRWPPGPGWRTSRSGWCPGASTRSCSPSCGGRPRADRAGSRHHSRVTLR